MSTLLEVPPDLAPVLAECERITRARARNFWYGLKLTPDTARGAMYVIYAWMRAADDLADAEGFAPEERVRRIAEFRAATDAALAGEIPDDSPVWRGLAWVAERHQLSQRDFHDMLDGQLSDVGPASYQHWDDLRGFCYRVASTVGLVCIRIWGYHDPAAPALAVDRGIAFQLTNILRDFREDYDLGRVYLPAEDFRRFDLTPESLRGWKQPEQCAEFMRAQCDRAEQFYVRSAPLDQMITPSCLPTLWAMTQIYHGLLVKIRANPAKVVSDKRVRLSSARKAWIAWRASRMARGARMTADVTPAVQSAADRSASVRGASVRSAVVIGGGIAGLACALRLAESGVQVTVLETRRKLGGRATSFTDPRTGEVLDNCQHVLMGCCTNLLDFYERLCVTDAIEWHPRVYWANPPHAPDVMKPGLLPAPAHFTESFASMRMLSLSAKRSVARAMWSMLRMGATGRAQWEGRTFSEFLQETGQSADVVTRFWSPVVVSACNLDVDEVSAAAAMQVFQEGFLANRQAPLMGLSTVPLVRLYDPAEGAILAAGGQVRMGVSALSIAYDGKRVTGVITDEGAFDADVVIGAVPADRLAKLVSATMVAADQRLQHLDEVQSSPILGVHLRFPKRVMDLPHLVLPGRATQWLFAKEVDDAAAEFAGTQLIHAVISGARDWMDLSEQEIARRVLEDIRWALPAAQGVEPISVRSVKEKRATFAIVPGFEAIRPRAAADGFDRHGGIRNLYLAGDWTRTGWPATMEGAVRSGYLAAGAVLGTRLLVPDLEPARLSRMLGVAR